jgi:polyphosphate kinase 2 (PPK2 family)
MMIGMVDNTTLDEGLANHKALRQQQKTFTRLASQLKKKKRPAIVIFEGWGAAGKGDIIRLVTARLDPRLYTVFANHRPEGAAANHHYLWRYWHQIPEQGQLAILDRSWYRRVLIDRIEGTCTQDEWERAYHEINQLERQLIDFGCLLVKFWLQISPDEQLRRFVSRENDDTRRWKIGPDDWQRRDRWSEVQGAVNDMLAATSTVYAPWTVIDSDSKIQSYLQTLQALQKSIVNELNDKSAKLVGVNRDKKKKRTQQKQGS